MEIIPAIDIMNGQCVRLTQGKFDTRKVYSSDPLRTAKEFEENGIRRLHLVDLDGARAKKIMNIEVLKNIAGKTSLTIDFGGGVQSDEDLNLAFEAGAAMVTAGSVAVTNRPLFEKWITDRGGEKLILGTDVFGHHIAVSGWEEKTRIRLIEFLAGILPLGVRYVLCTDIRKDGMLKGPSVGLYKELTRLFPATRFIASGGVSGLKDLEALEPTGIWGVIIGKAIYEGRIKLEELKNYMV